MITRTPGRGGRNLAVSAGYRNLNCCGQMLEHGIETRMRRRRESILAARLTAPRALTERNSPFVGAIATHELRPHVRERLRIARLGGRLTALTSLVGGHASEHLLDMGAAARPAGFAALMTSDACTHRKLLSGSGLGFGGGTPERNLVGTETTAPRPAVSAQIDVDAVGRRDVVRPRGSVSITLPRLRTAGSAGRA